MLRTLSLPSLQGPLWPGIVTPDRVYGVMVIVGNEHGDSSSNPGRD